MQLNTVAISVFLALSMLAAPLTADTQPPVNVRRIGVLSLAPPGPTLDTLRQGLRELGWVEDENVVLEEREAQGKHERFPGLAADLVQLRVDVIVTITTPAALAAKNATTTIPIVMAGVANPVELGLVASLARPGGNIMGLTHFPGPEFSGKGLGLLKEAVPGLTRVAVLFASRGGIQLSLKLDLDAQQAAAQALGITLIPLDVNTLDALRGAFVTTTRERADGLFVYAIGILREHEKLLVDFAGTNRLPLMGSSSMRSVFSGSTKSFLWISQEPTACQRCFKMRGVYKPVALCPTTRTGLRYPGAPPLTWIAS